MRKLSSDFLNPIIMDTDSGKAVTVGFLDLTKAFDQVSRVRLLPKVKPYGITDPFHSLTSPSQPVIVYRFSGSGL